MFEIFERMLSSRLTTSTHGVVVAIENRTQNVDNQPELWLLRVSALHSVVGPDALLYASTDRGRRLEDDWPGERGGPRRCLWRNSLTALASSGEPLRVFLCRLVWDPG